MTTTHLKLGFIGFGNVLRALAEMLPTKADLIEQQYGLRFSVVGISTHSHGSAINPDGLDLSQALALDDLSSLHQGAALLDTLDFIRACPADIILEGSWVNPQTGQPALDHCRETLRTGKHLVTANKGPIAFGYQELRALAVERDLGFFYESTVLDGVPLHSLAREGLLAAEVQRIRGVLNSTTNSILTRMAEGFSFEAAVIEMQQAGIAEADPTNDIDGWDAAIKIVILANTFMGADLRPIDVNPQGIRHISAADIQKAAAEGHKIKLVCEAWREADGQIKASVAPQSLPASDPLAWLEGTASAVTLQTDIIEEITLREAGPLGPAATAYGMLVDAINIGRGRR